MTIYTATSRLTNILASTLEKWKKEIAEHIIKEIPLFKYMDSKGSKMVLDGGTHYSYPLLCGGQRALFYDPATQTLPLTFSGSGGNFDPNAWVGAIGTGLSATPIMVAGRNDWSYLVNAIAITADEKLQNMGDSAIASLIKGKMRAAELHMAYKLNTSILSQTKATTAGYKFQSLQVVAPPHAEDFQDVGANSYLCSGVAYDNGSFNVAKWKNQYVAGQSDYSDLLDQFLDLWVKLKVEGAFKTDVIVLHSALYKKYESVAQNNVKFMDTSKLDFGFAAATYKGIPMIIDDLCLHSATVATDTRADECAYFLNTDSLGFFVHRERNIEIGKMIESQSYVDLDYCLMKWMGGMWCNNRRAQGIAIFNS